MSALVLRPGIRAGKGTGGLFLSNPTQKPTTLFSGGQADALALHGAGGRAGGARGADLLCADDRLRVGHRARPRAEGAPSATPRFLSRVCSPCHGLYCWVERRRRVCQRWVVHAALCSCPTGCAFLSLGSAGAGGPAAGAPADGSWGRRPSRDPAGTRYGLMPRCVQGAASHCTAVTLSVASCHKAQEAGVHVDPTRSGSFMLK